MRNDDAECGMLNAECRTQDAVGWEWKLRDGRVGCGVWCWGQLWSLMERIEEEVLTSAVDSRVIETIHLALGKSPERDAVMADDT